MKNVSRKFILCLALIITHCYLDAQNSNDNTTLQMVVTKKRYPSYDVAKKNSIDEITDGDSVWLYIKSDKPFKDIITIKRLPQSDGSVRKQSSLLLRLGPNNDWSPYNDYCPLCFGDSKECPNSDRIPQEALEKNEIALNLTSFSSKGSSKVMLSTVGAGSPGNWDNQIRVYVDNKQVTQVRLNCKLEDGMAKYKKMWEAYDDKLSKGDEESNVLPEPANFMDKTLQTQILQFVKQKNIPVSKVYFTKNGWTQIDESSYERYRYISSAFVYQKGGNCFYGIAKVRQNYSFSLAKYGASEIYIEDQDLPIKCKP